MFLIRRLFPLLALLAALMALVSACDEDEAERQSSPAVQASPTVGPPERVTFMAGFRPQANLPFAGVYIAKEKGFFAEENLDVEIKHVSTPGENFKFLASGEVQFSTADASAVLERRAGDPPLDIVSIALIGQRGQQGFAVLIDSGIDSPQDWAGKRAGYKGPQVTPDYLAILAAAGVDRASVEEVRVGFEPQVLTERQVDIFPVFVSNEPDTLRRLGFETKVFEAADYGAPTLGLTYVSSGDFISEKPDAVQRFLNAALRGIKYAEQNGDEAIDIVLQYAPMEDRVHQTYILETELNAARAENGFGSQTEEQWQRLHDFLVQYGALPRPIDDIAAVFTDRFLEGSSE